MSQKFTKNDQKRTKMTKETKKLPDIPKALSKSAQFFHQNIERVSSIIFHTPEHAKWNRQKYYAYNYEYDFLEFVREEIKKQSLIKGEDRVYDKIEIKVNPFSHKKIINSVVSKKGAINRANLISKNTAKHLEAIAQNAPKGLKEKLLKLASHAKK